MKGKVKCKKCGSQSLSLRKSVVYEETYGIDFKTGKFSEIPRKVAGEERTTVKCFQCGAIWNARGGGKMELKLGSIMELELSSIGVQILVAGLEERLAEKEKQIEGLKMSFAIADADKARCLIATEEKEKLEAKIAELEVENTVLKNETIAKLEGEIADIESQFGRRLDEVARKLSSRENVISEQVRRIIELENEIGSYKIIESMSKEEPAKRGRKSKGEVQ